MLAWSADESVFTMAKCRNSAEIPRRRIFRFLAGAPTPLRLLRELGVAQRSRQLGDPLFGGRSPLARGRQMQRDRHHSRIASTLTSTMVVMGFTFISGVVLAHLLGVEERGRLAAVLLWPTIIVYAGDLGGPVAYVYLSSIRFASIQK